MFEGGTKMIEYKEFLRIPGPTPIPQTVMNAMNTPIIYHRSELFGKIIENIIENGRKVFKTSGDILIFSATGRGVMEASVVNCTSPGEKVLVLINGQFGEIFADIAQSFGRSVEKLYFNWGESIDTKCFEKYIKDNSEIKTVFVIHCETSTGVVNDIKEIGRITNKYHKFLIVDAVSSLGGIDIDMSNWGIDIVLSASQKALMTPPGLGLVAIKPKAWKKIEEVKSARYYWDFRMYKEAQNRIPKQTPFTSPVSLMLGLNEALRLITEEGIDNVIERHFQVAKAFRDRLKSYGLKLFPKKEGWCSNTVTSVNCPDEINSGLMISALQRKYNLRVANGIGKLKGKIIRVGHMGYQADHLSTMIIADAIINVINYKI